MTAIHSAPKFASNDGVLMALHATLGAKMLDGTENANEVIFYVERETLEESLRLLRDEHEYQQLMEIAGVDYPGRAERFDVCYCLLSLTRNHRIIVKVMTDEATPVPTVTTLWPVAGWLEREVYDMYGVLFAGNPDLRRILTDYGFQGHPFRKDFPLTGYVELRYSEEDKRVVYEPVQLAQDLRTFDFMSPWEGADYVLPGDEKVVQPTPAPAPVATNPAQTTPPTVDKPKVTESKADTGAGERANDKAAEPVAKAKAAPKKTAKAEPTAPEPTEARPARKPRAAKIADTPEATETKPKRARKPKTDGGEA